MGILSKICVFITSPVIALLGGDLGLCKALYDRIGAHEVLNLSTGSQNISFGY